MEQNSVKHNDLDSLGFRDAMKDYAKLPAKIEEHEDTLEVVADLAKDLFCEMLKIDPKLHEKVAIEGKHRVQRDLIDAARQTETHEEIRRYTKGSEIHSAVATITGLDELMKNLPEDFNNEPEIDPETGEPAEDEDGNVIYHDADPDDIANAVQAGLAKAAEEAAENDHLWRGWGLDPSDPKGVKPETFYALAEQAKKSKRFRMIADMTGSMKRLAMHKQRTKRTNDEQVVSGLEKGGDLNRIHPSEYNDIVDKHLKKLFWLRYLDEEMDQFRMTGNRKLNRGSIICCVDNSGSMSARWNPGKDPFSWAMAVAVALAQVALKQNRNFVYIPFAHGCGTPIEIKVNDSPKVKFDRIFQMATTFMDGGTDFQKPLEKAIQFVEKGYPDADIVFITDGAARLTPEFVKKFDKVKDEMEMSCYGVCVEGAVTSSVEVFCDESISVTDITDTTNKAAIGDIFAKL